MIKDSEERNKEKKEKRIQKLKEFNEYWDALPSFFRSLIEGTITTILVMIAMLVGVYIMTRIFASFW